MSHGLLKTAKNAASNCSYKMGTNVDAVYAGRGMQIWVLYGLVAVMSSYIAIDLILYHGDLSVLSSVCDESLGSSTIRMEVKQIEKGTHTCESREEHYETDASSVQQKNPWQQMKWIGQPAACMVNGRLIEKLDDLNNFRRGFALKFVEDVEDKTHLLPWFLGSKIDLNRRNRRVYLDLGANRFNTSVVWFLRMYPCDFTEIHAFEANSRFLRQPKQGFDEKSNLINISKRSIRVKQAPGIPKWMLNRITIHYKYVADEDDEKKRTVNITRFIKEELKLRANDTVIVKMDIEGSEWPILRRWIEDPEMPEIVDELFLELHYADPSMAGFGWNTYISRSREDAKRLFAELRWKGFYVHAWP